MYIERSFIMIVHEKTGTSNWQSSCGADFSFVDKFVRNKAISPRIFQSVREEADKKVVEAYEYIQDVSDNEAADWLDEMRADVQRQNDLILAQENVNPEDGFGIPAYVESKLYPEPVELSSGEKQMIEENRQLYLSELYNAVMKDGLDSYLSEDTLDVLNSDKTFPYQAYAESVMLEEAHEMEQQVQREAKAKAAQEPRVSSDYLIPDEQNDYEASLSDKGLDDGSIDFD